MKANRFQNLGVTMAAVSLFLAGCECNFSSESNQLAEAEEQLQKDLSMYVGVWDQILNEGRIDLINEEHFTSDITLAMSPEDIVGIKAFKDYYNNFLIGFSDIEFTVEDAFGRGDKIVKHWTFKGTHTGEFFGIPATGNAVHLKGVTLVRMKDGKIAREEDYFDNLAFMQQLGLMPAE